MRLILINGWNIVSVSNRLELQEYINWRTKEVIYSVPMRTFYEQIGNKCIKIRDYQLTLEQNGVIDSKTFQWRIK